ncbi:MAG: hypothetical protein DCC69_02510 [Hyphomicrobiales bacterium]|nr:MAG: hypothetical protein DCC69_02510 [Hyphomicrobiales bacterium]
MNVSRLLIAAATTLSISAFSFAATAQEKVTLRVHSFSSPVAPEAVHMVLPFIEKVREESGGRLELEFYPGMQLGGRASDLIQQLEDGVVDFVVTIPGVTPGRFAGLEGMDMPFTNVGTSAGQTASLLAFADKWLLDNEFEGIKIIHMHATDAGVLHTTRKKIDNAAAMQGLRIRAPGRYVGEAITLLGGTPVGLALGEVYEALERGQIDGMAINWAIMPSYKFEEVTKFSLETPLYQTPIMVLMRQESYDNLPDDLKAVIDNNIGIEKSVEVAKKIDELTVQAKQVVKDAGNEIYALDDAERTRWIETATPVYKIWIDEMNSRGLPGQEMFDDILAITAANGRE